MMSHLETGDPRMQDIMEARGLKCRIPQRLPPNRTKTSMIRPKPQNSDNMPLRPKSANRAKDDLAPNRQTHPVSPRTMRTDNRPPLKRPSTIPKRVTNDTAPASKTRQIIMVPVAAKAHCRNTSHKNLKDLPDQETIKKREDLEVQQSEFAPYGSCDELECISSASDKTMPLKIKWEDKMAQFEKMREELIGRQRDLLEVYACLRAIHNKLATLGQEVALPPADDLRIMNVSNLTPRQLLQLCANSQRTDGKKPNVQNSAQPPIALDMNKLYNMPAKLVANCEQTLVKRKEIIDWFENLKKQEKGISISKLSKKINEFNAENEMLNCNLVKIKTEFYTELNDIVDVIRKGVNETISMQLRIEELMYELSELNSQNEDLTKKLHTADHLKSHNNRYRIEELEKELKEEKCKKMMMRERLSRAEGQVKINAERASQLEATLEQSRSQNRSLERTVQHLHEQNQKLQVDFDKELSKLTESIKENTSHLEEIADAREKLQAEKEQLEKRLEDLSAYYNESLENLRSEIGTNVVKLIATDERYQLEVTEKKKMEDKIESLCAQLLDSELKCKDLQKQVQDKEELISQLNMSKKELDTAQRELHIANQEINDYSTKLVQHKEQIKELEQKCKDSLELQEKMKCDLIIKEESIKELQQTKLQLEHEILNGKSKLASYEEQLSSLKKQFDSLQQDFGDFENISELCEMVTQQKEKLLEVSQQNEEMTDLLRHKEAELERQAASLGAQEQQLQKKNDIIKILSDKDEEQANIIKLLRNNLEMRSLADSELQQQLSEKNTEINKLITSLETRKQQISEFEKIIITLEDQTHKANDQITQLETIILSLEDQSQKDNLLKRKYEEKITILENKIQEYETYCAKNKRHQDIDSPPDNLDNLIKILENELGMPLEPHPNFEDRPNSNFDDREYMGKRKHSGDRKKREIYERDGEPPIYTETESMPTKIAMSNFGKHAHFLANEENYGGDNLDRKKAITNMDAKKNNTTESGMKTYSSVPVDKDLKPFRGILPAVSLKKNFVPRNLGLYSPDRLQEDKKCKMFKFAGHRL